MNKITNELMYELASSLPSHVHVDTFMDLVDKKGNPIILQTGDVNWNSWHKSSLKHDYFKFSTCDIVYIETEEQAEEFKNIVISYYGGRNCNPSISEHVEIFIGVDDSPIDKQINDYFKKNNNMTIKHIIPFPGDTREVLVAFERRL